MITKEQCDAIIGKSGPLTIEEGLDLLVYYIHDRKRVEVTINPPTNQLRMTMFQHAVGAAVRYYKGL